MRRKKLMHFSHHHPLRESNVKVGDELVCSCCELDLSGPAFKCIDAECEFFMHISCLELPEHINHKSHIAHSLSLQPPTYERDQFLCNACGENGSAFTYRCTVCDYELHVKCSSLPETVKREDHEHPISLNYSILNNSDAIEYVCDVCDENVNDGCWVYSCVGCDFGTHLDCATITPKAADEDSEEEEEEEEEEGENSGASDPLASANALMMAQLKAQQQRNLLQFQMQASQRQAQMMHSLASSMRNL